MSELIVKFHHDERGIARSWEETGKVVRCKDCVHYDGRPCGLVNWYNGKEDFCSRATERESGEVNRNEI